MTRRIGLISLLCPTYEDGIAFYVETLGFGLIEDTPLPDGKRWVVAAPDGGGCALLIARAVGERQCAAVGNQAGGRVLGFLYTDDFARDHTRFRANGVQFLEAPRHENYGTVAVFADPFGNRWDLIEPADDRGLRRAGSV